jgi:uncharacterized protein (DUF305 family)
MHMIKPALIVALVLLAGCGGSKAQEPQADVSVVRPGAPGKASQEVSAEELKEPDTVKPIAQDIVFMRGMIHHHQQAILMTGWVPERTQSPAVKLMAERMAATQSGEIERDLYAEGGGQETEIDFFARHIEADQEIEIKRMQDVLAAL